MFLDLSADNENLNEIESFCYMTVTYIIKVRTSIT